MEQLDRRGWPLHVRGMDRIGDQRGAHRHRAVGEPLGQRHQVRGDPEALRGKGLANPAEPGDDLIEHQQDAVLVAEFTQPLQVARGRQNHPGRAGHRFDEHRGDGGGIVQRDQSFQVVGELGTVAWQAGAEGIALQVQGVAQEVAAGQQRAELLAVVGQPADRHAAKADSVVGLLAADEAGALALAPQAVVAQHDLHRRIHRLRAGVAEEHVVERGRRQRGQALGQHERQWRAHLERRGEIQRGRLLLDRLHDPRAGMAGIAAPQPGGSIQHRAVVHVVVVHALGPYQQARCGLELSVGAERHPERLQRGGALLGQGRQRAFGTAHRQLRREPDGHDSIADASRRRVGALGIKGTNIHRWSPR
ncbi:hypothetical protein D3C71_952060 [compost metagenome]